MLKPAGSSFTGGQAILGVADNGIGIPATMHDRVFERFVRADEARAAGSNAAGLGLAIVREIVCRVGGTATIDPEHAPGVRLVIRLPLAAVGRSQDLSEIDLDPTTMSP